jgi:UDP-2,4-diacetamido-2,4,6-trideoxy-beta-L-altropyranose hydrolase
VRIFLRADASFSLGSGHVMRCLTVAEALAATGADISFICRDYPGNLCDVIAQKGYRVFRLDATPPLDSAQGKEEDARKTARILGEAGGGRWLVVDSYALDASWESHQRRCADRIMVIDDLADRRHDCDLLLDQNLYHDMEHRYDLLVPAGCRRLLGPRHALLRKEFIAARRDLRKRDGVVRRILVSFGGSDPTGETEKALEALRRLDAGLEIDVVFGANNPDRERLTSLCADIPSCTAHCQVSNMAELMAAADLALGSGGATTWERCYLGLPSITVVVAENQLQLNIAAAEAGITWNLGWSSEVTSDTMAEAIAAALRAPAVLTEMSARAFALMGMPPADPKATLIDILTGADYDQQSAGEP